MPNCPYLNYVNLFMQKKTLEVILFRIKFYIKAAIKHFFKNVDPVKNAALFPAVPGFF